MSSFAVPDGQCRKTASIANAVIEINWVGTKADGFTGRLPHLHGSTNVSSVVTTEMTYKHTTVPENHSHGHSVAKT